MNLEIVQTRRDRAAPMSLPAPHAYVYRQADRPDPIKVSLLHSDPIMKAGLRSAFTGFADVEVQHELDGMPLVIADYANALALMGGGGMPPRRRFKVIVAGTDRECEIRRALALGAKGYLVAFTPEELAACVRAVHRGEKYLSALAATRLAESVSYEPLTGREKDVLQLVVKGLANKQVAAQLGIALDTVKSHMRSIFDKLGVQSRTQAMAAAQARGMLEPS